jgi:heptosyltransferase III
MNQQLVPADVLAKTDKILFVTHLALGDFTYLQNYFQAFAQQYPHIKIHIWVDDVRRSMCFWRWEHLKKYALYDWLAACPFIHKVYSQTYRPSLLRQSLRDAQQEKYPLVVSLALVRPAKYARLARRISPQGFVAGRQNAIRFFNVFQQWSYKKLNAALSISAKPGAHISQTFADWFDALFGVQLGEQARFPFVRIPMKWIIFAKLRFLKWGIDKKTKRFGSVIFINAYAKTKKRSWPLSKVAELIRAIKQYDELSDVSFVVNVEPTALKRARSFFDRQSLNNTFLFSAEHNFFQLPAVMSLCDLVISVETSTMHLASALRIPSIALMRQKNPEWAPIDNGKNTVLVAHNRNAWVCDIPVSHVIQSLRSKSQSL